MAQCWLGLRAVRLLAAPTLSLCINRSGMVASVGCQAVYCGPVLRRSVIVVRSMATVVPAVRSTVTGKYQPLRSVVFDPKGNVQEEEISKPALAARLGVSMRDLRAIDPAYPRVLPQILVRERAFVLKLDMLRAVVTADRVMVFDPLHPAVQGFLTVLHDRLRADAASEVEPDAPFELRVLEEVLISVCASLERQFQAVSPAVSELLQAMTRGGGGNTNFDRLLPLSNSLRQLQRAVADVTEALETLLESDEELAGLYLTLKKLGVDRLPGQSREAEELIESYVYTLEQLSSEIQQQLTTVSATQDFTNTTLDSVRNRILRLGLMLNVSAFSLSVSACLASLWGMNLKVPLEEAWWGFPAIVSFLAVAGSSVFFALYRYCRRTRLL